MAIRFFQTLAAVGVLGVSCAAGLGSELCPVETELVGVHDTVGRGYAVHVEGDRLYVGTGINVGDGVEFGGVEIVDVSDAGKPVVVSRVDVLGDVFGVDVAGDLMFVAGGDAGVLVFDIGDEMNPLFVGGLQVADTVVAVDAGGDHADGGGVIYVAALKSGLLVVDVSVPGSIALMGSYVAEDWIAGLVVVGDVVYAAGGTSGVHAVDVGDPMNPVGIGVLDTAGFVSDVVVEDRVDGRVVYAADFGSMLVVDVDEPAMMSVVGSVETPGQAQAMAVGRVGDGVDECPVVYVSDGGSGMQVVLVEDVESPVIAGEYGVGGVFDVAVGDGEGLVYLAASGSGALGVGAVLACPDCRADMNGDGVLDFFDVSLFLSAFGSGHFSSDFSGDGVFDFFDVSAFLAEFSAGCP